VPDHYEWRNAVGATLLRIDWSGTGPSGWPTANFFSQPDLEDVLAKAIGAMPNVTLLRGAEVVDVAEQAEDVMVTYTTTGERRRARARFVIGCDGANSFVREHLGTVVHDQGFFYDWLIVDIVSLDDRDWSPQNWQLCDPARPTTLVSGGPGRRRWEFMLLPGETREELNTPDKAWNFWTPGAVPWTGEGGIWCAARCDRRTPRSSVSQRAECAAMASGVVRSPGVQKFPRLVGSVELLAGFARQQHEFQRRRPGPPETRVVGRRGRTVASSAVTSLDRRVKRCRR